MTRLTDLLNPQACYERIERESEAVIDELLGGDLSYYLTHDECRELLDAIMAQVFSPRRDFDRTPAEHNQTSLVFARDAIRVAAQKVADRIAGAA